MVDDGSSSIYDCSSEVTVMMDRMGNVAIVDVLSLLTVTLARPLNAVRTSEQQTGLNIWINHFLLYKLHFTLLLSYDKKVIAITDTDIYVPLYL